MTEGITPGGTPPAGGGEGTITFNNADEHRSHVNTNWRNFVPKEFAEHSSTANINSLEGLAKSYVSAQQMIGKDKIVKPTEKSTPEEWHAYYKIAGKPDTADGYKLSLEGIQLPQGYTTTAEQVKKFSEWAHKNNLTQAQAQAFWQATHQGRIEQMSAASANRQANLQEGWKKLKSELGAAFDTKIKGANEFLARFDTDGEIRAYLKTTGQINSPTIARFFMRIADNFSEDKLGTQQRTMGALTPTQARAKARDLLAKINEMKKGSFEHQQALEQYKKLQELAAKGSE